MFVCMYVCKRKDLKNGVISESLWFSMADDYDDDDDDGDDWLWDRDIEKTVSSVTWVTPSNQKTESSNYSLCPNSLPLNQNQN